MEIFNDVNYFLEILTGVLAVLFFRKHKAPFYKYFLAYALTAILVESIAVFCFKYRICKFDIFNIYTFFEYNFVALIYFNLTKEKTSHQFIKNLMLIFNIIYFLSFIFTELLNYTVILGAIIVSSFMVFYLRELLNSDKIINFQKSLSFWITIVFLLYYLTTIPFYSAFYIIGIESRIKGEILFYVHQIIIILTNICFIGGLLWSSEEKN